MDNMNKNKIEYVVVVTTEDGVCCGTEFLGKVDSARRAFHIIDDYDLNKSFSEEYGFPIEFKHDHVTKNFYQNDDGKLVYMESHYLHENDSYENPDISPSAHFYIFQA